MAQSIYETMEKLDETSLYDSDEWLDQRLQLNETTSSSVDSDGELENSKQKLLEGRMQLDDSDMTMLARRLIDCCPNWQPSLRVRLLDPLALKAASLRVRNRRVLQMKIRRLVQLIREHDRHSRVVMPELRDQLQQLLDRSDRSKKETDPANLLACLGMRSGESWDRLLVPICGPSADSMDIGRRCQPDLVNHWSCLVVVRVPNGAARFHAFHYDSMCSTNTKCALNACCVLSLAGVFDVEQTNSLRVTEVTGWPQQSDAISCGARTLFAMLMHLDFYTASCLFLPSPNVLLQRKENKPAVEQEKQLLSSSSPTYFEGELLPFLPFSSEFLKEMTRVRDALPDDEHRAKKQKTGSVQEFTNAHRFALICATNPSMELKSFHSDDNVVDYDAIRLDDQEVAIRSVHSEPVLDACVQVLMARLG